MFLDPSDAASRSPNNEPLTRVAQETDTPNLSHPGSPKSAREQGHTHPGSPPHVVRAEGFLMVPKARVMRAARRLPTLMSSLALSSPSPTQALSEQGRR